MIDRQILIIIAKYKLFRSFLYLITLSLLATFAMVISAQMIAAAMVNTQPAVSFLIYTGCAYIFSNALTLYLEIITQKVSANLAGAVGGEYIKSLSYQREEEEQIQSELTAKLTTQIERFRAELVLPAVSMIVRLIIVVLGAGFLFSQIGPELFGTVSVCILVFGLVYLALAGPIASRIDGFLSNALLNLGATVERVVKSRMFIYFSEFKETVGDEYITQYRQYGIARSLNGALNLFPRQLIELGAILVALFFAANQTMLDELTRNIENFATVTIIGYRLYPQFTMLIKNITTLMMSKTAFPIALYLDLDTPKALSEIDLKFGELNWDPERNRILLLNGPSGSGKSLLAKEIAKKLYENALNVGYVDSNGMVPLGAKQLSDRFLSGDFEKLKIEFGLSKLNADPSVWSNGQRQRLLIALCLSSEVDLLILDEGLAALGRDDLDIVLNRISQVDMPVILVSHHIDFLDRFPDAHVHQCHYSSVAL